MYFVNYFYVTVTDAAPKCPRAESPASSWPCAELSQRRVGGAELAAPSCPISDMVLCITCVQAFVRGERAHASQIC